MQAPEAGKVNQDPSARLARTTCGFMATQRCNFLGNILFTILYDTVTVSFLRVRVAAANRPGMSGLSKGGDHVPARQPSSAHAAIARRRAIRRTRERGESLMQTTMDLREVTDRVLGLSPPRVPMPARMPRRLDQPLGLVLLLVSALGSAVSLGLWANGHGGLACRVFGGTILLLALALRML